MLKWYLDKDYNVSKFELQIRLNTNIQLNIGVLWHKNECSPTILIQTKPFIVSMKVSMISLIHKAFRRLLHDMLITVEMPLTGYPKVW